MSEWKLSRNNGLSASDAYVNPITGNVTGRFQSTGEKPRCTACHGELDWFSVWHLPKGGYWVRADGRNKKHPCRPPEGTPIPSVSVTHKNPAETNDKPNDEIGVYDLL